MATSQGKETLQLSSGETIAVPTNFELVPMTALNTLNIICENMVQNTRVRQNTAIEFPSLYQLAFKVYHAPITMLVARNIPVKEQ